MNRLICLSVMFCSLALIVADAQVLTVAYIDGQAEVQKGASWNELAVGGSLGSDSKLRLGSNSFVELSGAGARITLSQPGVYSISRLLSAVEAMNSAGVGKALVGKLSSLVAGRTRNQSSVEGVRGADESKAENDAWVASEAQVYIRAGKDFIQSGDYERAIKQLIQAQEVATDSELPEVHYTLGYAYSLSGDTRGALKQVANLKPSDSDQWLSDFVVLKAKLLLDTFAFDLAVKWLTENGGLAADAQHAQLYYMLLALGYRGLGDQKDEAQNINTVVSMDANSDLGKAAAELSKNL